MGWPVIALYAYGIAVIGMAVEAFVSKHSVASLMGGGFAGVLAVAGAALIHRHPRVGYALAGLGAVVVLGRFLPAYLKSHTVYPALVLTLLSAAALVVVGVGYAGGTKAP